MTGVLAARNVTRSYGGAKVLDNVSLTLPPGEITALLGGSGAGKSTLLRIMAGLETVDEGEIWLGGQCLSAPGHSVPAEKRRTGLIFQDFALFPHLDALRNVTFGLRHLGRARAEAEAYDWLERLGLSARARAYPHELSGGEQQRVAIARALAPAPAAILMDEPFSGLDPGLRGSVREAALAAVRAAGIPALLVTHDAAEALDQADRIAVLDRGRLLQEGSGEEIYLRPADPVTAAALGPVNRLRACDAPPGLLQAADPNDQVIVRPEGVLIDPASPMRARVDQVRLVGALTRITLTAGKIRLQALAPRPVTILAGEETGIRLDPDLLFTFPSS